MSVLGELSVEIRITFIKQGVLLTHGFALVDIGARWDALLPEMMTKSRDHLDKLCIQ